MFESAKIDVSELMKLLPSSEINVREPSIQMFNFFGYLVCNSWTVQYRNNNDGWTTIGFQNGGYSMAMVINRELARLWIPWLILRSTNLRKWFEEYKRLEVDLYTTEGIKALIKNGQLPADIERIIEFTQDEIKKGICISKLTGETVKISYPEKQLWLFLMQSRYGDTATYNLKHYLKAFDEIKNKLEK